MVSQQRAPSGGTRIGGKFYRGGAFLPETYQRGVRIIGTESVDRQVDPAAGFPDAPPNFGRPIAPHIATFIGVESSFSKAYRFADEALKHSRLNAAMMINDPAITEPLFSRMLLTSQLAWHIEPEDVDDPRQKQVAEELTMLCQRIPHFTDYRFELLWAIFLGRYAIENQFETIHKNGRDYYSIKKWIPVDGDKLLFRFDDGSGKYDPDQIGIRMSPAIVKQDELAGAHELEPTYDGLGYFLKSWERRAFVLHRHMRMDGAYESPRDAGRIHGVGLRSFLYWSWYQKQETLAQLVEIVERSAAGFTIYYYPEGNQAAKEEVEKIAATQAHTNILIMPRSADGLDAYEPQVIAANTAGIDALNDLITSRFDHAIKRMILGQILSSEADATGLGSGVATLQKDTLSNIVDYDSDNLSETLTRELVWVLRDLNFPEWRDVNFRFVIDAESSDPAKDLAALRQGWEMGAEFKEQAVHDILGTSPPKTGEKKLFNPVVAQQLRLAVEEERKGGVGNALSSLLGGSQDDVAGGGEAWEPPQEGDDGASMDTGVDTYTSRKAGGLAAQFYGQYITDTMGGHFN